MIADPAVPCSGKLFYISAFPHQPVCVRTTLDLPDPLFKEVKTRAIQEGVTLKELLATYIEAGLRGRSTPASDIEPRANTHPLPIAWERVPGAPPTPSRTNAEIEAILDQEDLDNHHRVMGQTRPKP